MRSHQSHNFNKRFYSKVGKNAKKNPGNLAGMESSLDNTGLPKMICRSPVKSGSFLDTSAYRFFQPILICMRLTGLVFVKDFHSPTESNYKRRTCQRVADQIYSTFLLVLYAFTLLKTFPAFSNNDKFGAALFMKILAMCWFIWVFLNAVAFYMASYKYHALPEYIIELDKIRKDNAYCQKKAFILASVAFFFIVLQMCFGVYLYFFIDTFDEVTLSPFNATTEYILIMRIYMLIVYFFVSCAWVLPVPLCFTICTSLVYEFRCVNIKLEEYIHSESQDVQTLKSIRLEHQKVSF